MNPGLPAADTEFPDFFKSLEYCWWLSEQYRLRPAVPTINRLEQFYVEYPKNRMGHDFIDLDKPGYRLPTAGEWELACGVGTSTNRSFGSNDERLREYAWYASNSQNSTHPVAMTKPNESGLFDMLGNVSEWCLDLFQRDFPPTYQPELPMVDFADDRLSPYREYRGGSYDKESDELLTSIRNATSENKGFRSLGFRIARTYPPAVEPELPITDKQPQPATQ